MSELNAEMSVTATRPDTVRMTMYRAAELEGGYFGFKSYWTPSRAFAEDFGWWVKHHAKREAEQLGLGPYPERGPMGLWIYDIIEPREQIFDLRARPGRLVPSDILSGIAERLAQQCRWVIFIEGMWRGRAEPQAVYLGQEPLRPKLVPPVKQK